MTKNVSLIAKVDSLSTTVSTHNKDLAELKNNILAREHQIDLLQTKMLNESVEITVEKEKEELRAKLQQKELENENLKSLAQQAIKEKELEKQKLQEQLQSAQVQLKNKDMELQKSKEKIAELEQSKENTWALTQDGATSLDGVKLKIMMLMRKKHGRKNSSFCS